MGGRPDFVQPVELAERAMQEAAMQSASGVHRQEELTLTAVPFGEDEGEEGGDRGVVLIYSGPMMASVRTRGDSGADA